MPQSNQDEVKTTVRISREALRAIKVWGAMNDQGRDAAIEHAIWHLVGKKGRR